MTTINTIEDLVRILREQPTWAEALRALLLTQDLLDLPGRFDRFVEAQLEFNQAQQETKRLTDQRLQAVEEQLGNLTGRFDRFVDAQLEFNQAQQETNRLTEQQLNSLDGRMGNLEGGQYERSVRTRALARSMIVLGFEAPYVALNQEGLTDPRLNSAIARAVRDRLVS